MIIDTLHIITLILLLIYIGTIIEKRELTPVYLGPIVSGLVGLVVAYHGIQINNKDKDKTNVVN